VNDTTTQLVMEGSLSGRGQNADIADTLHTRDVAMATSFGVYVGATWRMRLNRPCAVAMRLYVKLL